MTDPDPATQAASDAYLTLSGAVLRIATAAGADTHEKLIWPDGHSTLRYAEPLAGIRAARTAEHAARRVVGDYIKHARVEGAGWREIGEALGLEGDDLAVAAYEFATGPANLMSRPTFGFTCAACGQAVIDYGPYGGGPVDSERGHADGCTRMAAMVAAYEAQWADEDEGKA